MSEAKQETEQAKEATTDKANGGSSPLVINLRKAVIANGDEVTSLSFREPTAGDIERIGNPVNIDFLSGDKPKATFDSKMMTQMMATLAGVPPSTIRQMNTRDWNTAAYSLATFFMPEM
jgi:hypothetical protein